MLFEDRDITAPAHQLTVLGGSLDMNGVEEDLAAILEHVADRREPARRDG